MSRGRPDHLLFATEVALWLVTLAAVVGMHRLFVDGSYWGAVALQATVAHVVVAVLRRVGVGLVPAALGTAAAGVLFISWTRFPETTAALLPTADTFDALRTDVTTAWELFGEVRAPAPVVNGFIAVSAVAVWIIAFLADWAAFRVTTTFEALLPAATLFVFSAALGGGGSAVTSAAVFSAASLGYVLLRRTANQERAVRWAGEQRGHGRSSLVATGAVLVGVAVVGGALAGPNLPGADAEPVVAWRDLNQDEPTRVVPSPIVQLQTQLIDQPDVEVFNVRSEVPSYWRLTALDDFDGEIWRSSYSTGDADGELSRAFEPETASATVTQTVTIEALDSVWLPAAYEPVAIDTGEQATDYDERSSTLMVDREVESSDGYSYEVTSQVPDWTAAQLQAASPDVPGDIADTYLALPDDFPQQVRSEAERLTSGVGTPYDRARALQDHLRTFTYDQEVGPGHSEDNLVRFLFETQRGYCEQFAASFAALARAAGVPARVAIGFTWGVQDPNDPTLYRVRGVHAHAWAEVYLGEYGWVPFDPTPGRAPPGADAWLGVPADQDTSSGGASDPVAGADQPPVTQPGGAGDATRTDPTPSRPQAEETAIEPGATGDGAPPLPERLTWLVVRAVLLVGLGYLVLVPIALGAQQAIRRRNAHDPGARVLYLWQRTVEQGIASGLRLPEHLTVAEMATILADDMPEAAEQIHGLARAVEGVAYAEVPPSAQGLAAAESTLRAVTVAARSRRSWWRRGLRWLDVRRLATAHRRRTMRQGVVARTA